jgi:hypothetical protein
MIHHRTWRSCDSTLLPYRRPPQSGELEKVRPWAQNGAKVLTTPLVGVEGGFWPSRLLGVRCARRCSSHVTMEGAPGRRMLE